MILQLFPIVLLLCPPINASIQSSSSASPVRVVMSIYFRLPLSHEAACRYFVDKWFEKNFVSSAGTSLFIENIDLEVTEFSLGQEKSGYGVKYCQIAGIPSPFKIFNESSGSLTEEGGWLRQCKYALFVHQNWFQNVTTINRRFDVQDSKDFRRLLNWRMHRFNFSLFPIDQKSSSSQTFVLQWDLRSKSKLCMGKIKNIDEFKRLNTTSQESMIYQNLIEYYRFYKHRFLLVIFGASLGVLIIFKGRSWLIVFIKKAKKIKLRKFFEMKDGLLLQQMLHSCDGSVDRCKQFNAKELDKATDHFNENRILGQGGHGTVYKGMLEDGRIIAVKKFKTVDEEKLEEFINELAILSQINHRNVVKLLGYCLKTEVPLLVYQFIQNGTLFEYLHNRKEEHSLTWEMRLRIATEVAVALSYLHSSAAIPIYHRDIKSTNILLDENYSAKVADFGTSKFISIDQTHLTTKILGTFGYLDPEYYQSSQLTDKSDVYSFGVVLVELLTGEKPIFSSASQENINLAKYFIYAMKENHLHDILDDQVKQTGKKGEIIAFANLTKRCLNLKGKERPTMKEVATELERIRVLKKKKGMFNKIMKYF